MIIETSENYIREMLAPRPRDAHKGNFGRLLLICGSEGMAGAAILCARAALRSGAGLVTCCIPPDLFPILQTAVPEATCIPRDAGACDTMDFNQYDAIAAGPGLRVGRDQYRWIEHLLISYRGPLILDADGINCVCSYGRVPERETYMETEATEATDAARIPRRMTSILPQITARRKAPVILTPHPGEADRLLTSLDQPKCPQLGRETAAQVLARETGAIVVLKGAQSLVAAANAAAYGAGPSRGEADIFRNPTGNPGMATGGSGDVLTGVIAALAAQGAAGTKAAAEGIRSGQGGWDLASGLSPMDAARVGVYIHGLAGDIAAETLGEISMTAGDIAEALPQAFRRITDG